MSIIVNVTDSCKEIKIEDTSWTSLKLFGDITGVTIKNVGGTPVSIYYTETNIAPTDDQISATGEDPIELGGLHYEATCKADEYIWGKALTGDAVLNVRIQGTVDPGEDTTYISNSLNTLRKEFEFHINDLANPHKVTKAQVGLGNIPNAISSDPTEDATNKLATIKAVNLVKVTVDAHIANLSNPHKVTKAQVGLGNVPNYGIATESEAIAGTVNNKFMTPHLVNLAITTWLNLNTGMSPQTVMAGATSSRIGGWANTDCDLGIATVTKASTRSIRINPGLKLAYANNGKVSDTKVLAEAILLNYGSTVENGTQYIYVDIDGDSNIVSGGTTALQPYEGILSDGRATDFFCTADCTMYDSANNIVKRVYIAKVYFEGNGIVNITCVPFGTHYIVPVTTSLALSGRYLFDNPFISRVQTLAEVKYHGTWGPTYWNDQSGIMTSSFPSNPIDNIVLQCGKMGFMSSGEEAGSPFGATFNTITIAPVTRIRVTRLY